MKVTVLLALLAGGCSASPYTPPALEHGGRIILDYMPAAAVDTACRAHNLPTHNAIRACADVKGPYCHVIIRLPTAGDAAFAADLEHEAAHCQGWKHPDWS